METQGFEPWSSQGKRRAFYMLSGDLDCRVEDWLTTGLSDTVHCFVSLLVTMIIEASAAGRRLLIHSAAQRVGRRWHLLNPPGYAAMA